MQAVFTLARIAKEDAVEAFRLYFEPLIKLLMWLRNRSASAVEKKREEQLRAAVASLEESTRRGIEALVSSRVDYELQRTAILREVSLVLVRPESLRLGSMHVRYAEDRIQAISRILDTLRADTARMDALLSLASIEGTSVLKSFSIGSLLSHRELLHPSMTAIGISRLGKTDLLDHLLGEGRLVEESQILVEGMAQTHLPEVRSLPLKRFGIYLEVAAFLAQEGYEEAAVAVVTRAFKLFRPGEVVNPVGEEK